MNRMIGRATVAAGVVIALISTPAAVRAQRDTVDVTGKWAFAVETAAGSGTPTMTFKQDGEKLTGHYSGQLGEADLNPDFGRTIANSTRNTIGSGERLQAGNRFLLH